MIRHFCLSGGSDFAILTLSYPYNFTEFLRKLWQDWKGGRRHLDEKREDLGPLLVEQFRQQMNNLSAAIQLLTPVVGEGGAAVRPLFGHSAPEPVPVDSYGGQS